MVWHEFANPATTTSKEQRGRRRVPKTDEWSGRTSEVARSKKQKDDMTKG